MDILNLIPELPKVYHTVYCHPHFYREIIKLVPISRQEFNLPFGMKVVVKESMPKNMLLMVGEGKNNFKFIMLEDENE